MDNNPTQQVTAKQTKAEILDAYQTLLQQYQERAKQSKAPRDAELAQQEKEIVDKTKDFTAEKIIENIAQTKHWVHEVLEKLGAQLSTKVQQLTDVQKAIEIERKNLEAIHHISTAAITLSDIIAAQEEARRQHEREEAEYRHKRDLSRAEEESRYTIQQQEKRREFAEHVNNKQAELAEKEKQLNLREQELENLRAEATAFPDKLEKAIVQERERVISEQKGHAATRETLTATEVAGGRKILELRISALEEQLKETRAENVRLSKQLETAIQKNQELAAKLIEGVSGLQSFKLSAALKETPREQTKE